MNGRRAHLYRAQSGKCYYCTRQMHKSQDGPLLCTIDHKFPRSRGGMKVLRNEVAACKACNGMKGDMTEAEFRVVMKSDEYRSMLERDNAERLLAKQKRRSSRRAQVMAGDGPWGRAMPKPPASIHNRFCTSVEEVFGDILADLRAAVAQEMK